MNTYLPLVSGFVYMYGDELLEAFYLDDVSTFRLYILSPEDASYVLERNGVCFGYELVVDAQGQYGWQRLFYVQIAPIYPAWSFLRGPMCEIDSEALEFVALSRDELQAAWQEEDEAFWSLMSELSWEEKGQNDEPQAW